MEAESRQGPMVEINVGADYSDQDRLHQLPEDIGRLPKWSRLKIEGETIERFTFIEKLK